MKKEVIYFIYDYYELGIFEALNEAFHLAKQNDNRTINLNFLGIHYDITSKTKFATALNFYRRNLKKINQTKWSNHVQFKR